jgi:hypothetical protein
VNTRHFFLFIVGILLGSMAMADSGSGNLSHPANTIAYDTGAVVKSLVIAGEDAPTLSCNEPQGLHIKIRTRFRNTSFYKIRAVPAYEQANTIFPSSITPLYTGRAAFILPFYYVFLFRLTPF